MIRKNDTLESDAEGDLGALELHETAKKTQEQKWLAFRIVVLIFDVHIFFLDIFVTIFEAIICTTW